MNEPDTPPHRSAFPVLRTQQTRWNDNDQYGHVNNAMYYAYFDSVVNGYLLEASGVDIRALPAIGLVVETSCRYYAPTSFPDVLAIGLAVERLGNSSITYRLAVFRGEDEQATAAGRFVHVYVEHDSRKPVPVPEEIRAAVTPLVRD